MARWCLIEKKLVHSHPNNTWYVATWLDQVKPKFYFALTHSGEKKTTRSVIMNQYAAQDLAEFLKPESLAQRLAQFETRTPIEFGSVLALCISSLLSIHIQPATESEAQPPDESETHPLAIAQPTEEPPAKKALTNKENV